MPSFKLIDNINEIKNYNKWTESLVFKSKNKVVNKQGRYVSEPYLGHNYQLVSKKERSFSSIERMGRIFLGALVVVCSLGFAVVFFSKSVKKLFTKQTKSVRFGICLPFSSNLPNERVSSGIRSKHDSSLKTNQAELKTTSIVYPISPQKTKENEGGCKNKKEEEDESKGKELQQGVVISEETRSETEKVDEEYKISEKELQQGIVISEETISKIQMCMKNILQYKKEEGVQLYNSQEEHRVFALETVPGLIFKMNIKADYLPDSDDFMKARHEKMINAQTVLRTHQLGLLVLPRAKIFNLSAEGEEYEILAEQKLDITSNESIQEQYFEDYADSLNETICQLAVFICKTGYSDVEWRNNPVLNNSLDAKGSRKIALVDIEEMDSKEAGLFGGRFGRTGLVGLVNEEQGKRIENVAKENGVNTSSFVYAYDRRKKIMENNSKLKDYYAKKSIFKGDESIHVDMDSLSLDLNKEGIIHTFIKIDGKRKLEKKIVTLKTVAEEVVKEINNLIQQANKEEQSLEGTPKSKRYLVLNGDKHPLDMYMHLGLPKEGYLTEETEKQRWFFLIIQSLIEKGHIFNLDKYNGTTYYIQA